MKERVPHGWKVCKHCKELVKGPRTLVCPHCEGDLRKDGIEDDGFRTVYSFPVGYVIPNPHIPFVSAPAGECPVKLSLDENDNIPSDDVILDWAGETRQRMIHNGYYLKNSALVYWARQQLNRKGVYAPGGPEMKVLRELIERMPDITTRKVEV